MGNGGNSIDTVIRGEVVGETVGIGADLGVVESL